MVFSGVSGGMKEENHENVRGNLMRFFLCSFFSKRVAKKHFLSGFSGWMGLPWLAPSFYCHGLKLALSSIRFVAVGFSFKGGFPCFRTTF